MLDFYYINVQDAFTDALSGEKCVIISAIHPLLKHILEKLATCSIANRLMFCERDKRNYIRQTTITVHTVLQELKICLMYLLVLIPDFSYARWSREIKLFSKLNRRYWKFLTPILMCLITVS